MTGRRPRVLFVGEGTTLAHIARLAVLAGTLDHERYDIHVASPDTRATRAVLADSPYPHWPVASIPEERFLRRLGRGFPLWTTTELERAVESDRELLRTLRPDLVVTDLRVSMSTSATLEGIHHAAIVNVQWSAFAAPVRQPVPETLLSPYIPGVSQALFDVVRPLAFWLYTRPVNSLRRRFGLPSFGARGYALYAADDVLYVDSPMVVRLRAPLPPNHRFVGPAIWSPRAPLPPWWERLGDDEPLVYVSLGSSGKLRLLPTILRALADGPYRVAAAVGGRRAEVEVPANAYVAPYLPGGVLARRSTVVVGNGGSPGLYQSFAEGTPVVGIPQNLDQHMSMASVAHLGATLTLRSERLSARTIRRAVDRMIDDPSFRAAARRVQADFAAHRASDLFPRYVASVVG